MIENYEGLSVACVLWTLKSVNAMKSLTCQTIFHQIFGNLHWKYKKKFNILLIMMSISMIKRDSTYCLVNTNRAGLNSTVKSKIQKVDVVEASHLENKKLTELFNYGAPEMMNV